MGLPNFWDNPEAARATIGQLKPIIALLRPYALFGLSGLDSIAHALFWTMVVNVGLYVAVSLVTSQTIIERSQANQFVDIFGRAAAGRRIWRGRATIGDLRRLLARFIGEPLTQAAFHRFTLGTNTGRRPLKVVVIELPDSYVSRATKTASTADLLALVMEDRRRLWRLLSVSWMWIGCPHHRQRK